MNKKLPIILLILIVAIGGIWWLVAQSGSSTDNQNDASLARVDAVAADDHILGTGSVLLIEYSDLQCPACAAFQPIVKQLTVEFDGKMQLVYRHYPLSQHKHAATAARAAEAADMQGKFWEYHDILFEKQDVWADTSSPTDLFVEYATTLELDIERFKTDMDSDTAKTKVTNDTRSGDQLRLKGTPTFFLNGQRISPRTFDEFKSLVQTAVGT